MVVDMDMNEVRRKVTARKCYFIQKRMDQYGESLVEAQLEYQRFVCAAALNAIGCVVQNTQVPLDSMAANDDAPPQWEMRRTGSR